MYYVAWIYALDSIPWIGYLRLRRYRQEQVYHSRDIKPHTLDKSWCNSLWLFVGTLIGLLPYYRLMIDPAGNRGGTADGGGATAMLQSWRNEPMPPRVPRLAITLSSSESVARSCSILIWGMFNRRMTLWIHSISRQVQHHSQIHSPLKPTLVLG